MKLILFLLAICLATAKFQRVHILRDSPNFVDTEYDISLYSFSGFTAAQCAPNTRLTLQCRGCPTEQECTPEAVWSISNDSYPCPSLDMPTDDLPEGVHVPAASLTKVIECTFTTIESDDFKMHIATSGLSPENFNHFDFELGADKAVKVNLMAKKKVVPLRSAGKPDAQQGGQQGGQQAQQDVAPRQDGPGETRRPPDEDNTPVRDRADTGTDQTNTGRNKATARAS